MKTKQLLEILLKIIGIIIFINSVSQISSIIIITFMTVLEGPIGIDIGMAAFSTFLLLVCLYYLIIKTEVLVKLVYNKTEEEDRGISLKIHRSELIFFSIVVSALLAIAVKLPKLLLNIFLNINFRSSNGILSDYLDRNSQYVINTGVEIIILVILLLNAQRITNRIELYRRKQMKNRVTETKEIE